MIKPRIEPPPPDSLPAPVDRPSLEAEPTVGFSFELQTVTPVLGGGYRTREVDEIDLIRVPSVRGHLRFWWRATHGASFERSDDLANAESSLWGGTNRRPPIRSSVEIRIEIVARAKKVEDDIDLRAQGAYALWPARAEKRNGTPPAPRWSPGLRFRLTVGCPRSKETEVRDAMQAWILFGGYGSRTRRGLGALTVVGPDSSNWLPRTAKREAIEALFSEKGAIFAPSRHFTCDMPVTQGASIMVGAGAASDALVVWNTSLRWLSTFRQGEELAREPGRQGHPGRSKWPEPDKIRRLNPNAGWTHQPRHNERPVWPRAGFGLPIVGRFKDEPQRMWEFELAATRGGKEITRLASPLILKALPLADGTFVPMALWLERAYPKDARVCLKSGGTVDDRSLAEFDELCAPGDKLLVEPLNRGTGQPQGRRLRTAFMYWLRDKQGAVEVVP